MKSRQVKRALWYFWVPVMLGGVLVLMVGLWLGDAEKVEVSRAHDG